MKKLFIFKAHFWDEDVARNAAAAKANCPDCDFVVFYDKKDEGGGPGDDFPIVYHTDESFLRIGLFKNKHHRPMLWYNGDYSLYLALMIYPAYDYYILGEYDLLIRAPIGQELDDIARKSLDLVAGGLSSRSSDWQWFQTVAGWYPSVIACIFPLVMASRRAVEYLLQERLNHAESSRNNGGSEWAFCEGFVPSALDHAGTFTMASLSAVFDLSQFRVTPTYSAEEVCQRSTKIVHPFLSHNLDVRKARELEALIRQSRADMAAPVK